MAKLNLNKSDQKTRILYIIAIIFFLAAWLFGFYYFLQQEKDNSAALKQGAIVCVHQLYNAETDMYKAQRNTIKFQKLLVECDPAIPEINKVEYLTELDEMVEMLNVLQTELDLEYTKFCNNVGIDPKTSK